MRKIKNFLVPTALFIAFFGYCQLPTYVPVQDLQAWYSYSGNILDNSGNGHNNANYNVVSTNDRFNTLMRALYFSGSGLEYLNYGDVEDFEASVQLSFSFWILPENHGGNNESEFQPILSKWSDPNNLSGSSYMITMDGDDLCLILSDGFDTDTLRASLSTIPLNQWTHVVITTNYGFIKIFINNVLVTDTVTAISTINNSTADFKIADWYHAVNTNYSAYQGKFDDLGIWKRELNSCEVDALYTGNVCATAGINNVSSDSKKLIRITDTMGREVKDQSNRVIIFIYSDGSVERKFRIY